MWWNLCVPNETLTQQVLYQKVGCLEREQKKGVKEQFPLLPSFTFPTTPPDPISSPSPIT